MRGHFASSRERYRRYLHERQQKAGAQPQDQDQSDRLDRGSQARHRTVSVLFRRLLMFLHRQRRLVVLSLICMTIASILRLAMPAATGFIFDYVLGDRPLPEMLAAGEIAKSPLTLLGAVSILVMAVSLISVSMIMVGRYLNQLAVKRLQANIRKRLYRHAVHLPLHQIHRIKSGGMASLLRNDAGVAGLLLTSLIFNPWASLVQLVGTIVVLSFVDWRLLVGALVIFPALFLGHRVWVDRIRPLWRDVHASRAKTDSDATESFSGIRVVRGFGREATEAKRFVTNHNMEIRQEMKAWWGTIVVEVAWALLVPVAVAALLWYGGARVLSDELGSAAGLIAPADALTTGDLVMFLFYLAMLLEPMAVVARSGTEAQHGLAGLDRVLDLLDQPEEHPFSAGTLKLRPKSVRGSVAFRNVGFQYQDTTEAVIRNVSLDIQAGQTVALVGRSGAGKSTLCNLIARFFEPTQGIVELDGIDIQDIEIDSYRKLVSIVEQDVFLFDGTIAENISYGRPEASLAEIKAVSEVAHVAEFVNQLENGFETVVGERGVHLSGGQRQRLTIARALLANPRILILDEATSDLDSESERFIQTSLQTLMEGRTVLVIAHRLSTIAGADLVVVLDQGRVVDSGTPAELWRKSENFKTVMQSQLQEHGAAELAKGNRP